MTTASRLVIGMLIGGFLLATLVLLLVGMSASSGERTLSGGPAAANVHHG